MIYIKRVANADVTRQIDLNNESANLFFDFNSERDQPRTLTFKDEKSGHLFSGTIKKSGHGNTITGDFFGAIKDSCKVGDIIVFKTNPKSIYTYYFYVVKQNDQLYSQYNQSLNLLGSWHGGLNTTTHLVAAYDEDTTPTNKENKINNDENVKITSSYRPFITAIKSKPFLLLAGISGTGKSRIVRELARACWDEGSEEYKAQKPKNFEMVQVKPNWHDSSELIGYVSRIDGVRYVVGPFLKFMVKAMQDPETPYFLCLDEMNLAPVEQYFAEYLSVVESRKKQDDGTITTDPIIEYSNTEEYKSLIDQLFPNDEELRIEYLTEGSEKRLRIPNNLIVVGTVNMDETTFSFSRKVLDRAMTIEMNEVDLTGGLDSRHEKIGKLGAAELIGNAVEGVDVYSAYKDVCDTAIAYLQKINDVLEGTPFKIAYRTRNEVLLYVVNNLPYNNVEGDEDSTYIEKFVVARALDEITNMKILSRIEGDESKVSQDFLNSLKDAIHKGLESVFSEIFDEDDDEEAYISKSLAKLEEMKKRLESGYTSFWS